MTTTMARTADAHSYARPDEARVTHVALDLTVDFAARVLRGTATLDLEVAPGATEVVLDTRRLAVRGVRGADGGALTFTLGPDDPVLGSSLAIALPDGARRVAIDYETTADAEALQWLEPEQTAGGEHPFLFTQGHAIQTRSWIPLQDSPALRVTYEARITPPAPLVAVMSAERAEPTPDAPQASCFRMPERIPAYLVALAVGDIAMATIGPRTAVFAEPTLLARAAHEFGEMEQMIDAAEKLVGPYLWGRFDVLVMPPSFPYGGMENPRLTFASPTLLAGDRSLTTVIAHELAHAWAGNLVTNATWDDFWINEGTTVYLELRINEALWGAERAEMLKSSGFRDLTLEIGRMGESAPDTRLCYEMAGRDPAEGVTVVPYLKGAAFFWTIERVVGRARLDPWLQSWFARQAFRSVTTETLLADLRAHLLTADEAAKLIDLEAWVTRPGVPTDGAPPASELMRRIDDAARRVLAGESASSLDVDGWTPQAWRHFLGTLLVASPTAAQVEALDASFAISASRNAEVEAPWLRLAVRCELEAAVAEIERFLADNGRMKYLRPLYTELVASPWGAPIARRTYARARGRYHALVRAGLDRLVGTAGG
jgi:leukotriene-A4 hydrolase